MLLVTKLVTRPKKDTASGGALVALASGTPWWGELGPSLGEWVDGEWVDGHFSSGFSPAASQTRRRTNASVLARRRPAMASRRRGLDRG